MTDTPIGRDAELAALSALLDDVRGSRATRFALVQGEPGIGKSFLVAELARRAANDGWQVLNGRGTELEQDLPFALVVDSLDAHVGALDPVFWRHTPPEELAELAGILPSLRDVGPEPAYPQTAAERFKAHRAVAGLYERLAARRPVLLILDDLQWADGASTELAAYFLRRPPAGPVAIVGTVRSGQADPQLVRALGSAERDGSLLSLTLAPLNRADAERLVGGGAVDNEVYRESGGNPFYLLALVRARGDSGSPVPSSVAAAIADELEGLPDVTRAFLDAAAVAGDPFELDLAAAIGIVDDHDALSAIDVLVGRDLIRSGSVPRTFGFRHPLVRAAVYEALAPGSRIAAHQRAAEVLREREASAIERAQHVEHAARYGDTDAVGVLAAAAQAVVARAPRTASRWLETALGALPTGAPAAERRGLLTVRAGALAATGRLADSRAALVEALELAGEEPAAVRAGLISACAGIEQVLGLREQSERRLTRAIAEIGDADPIARAALTVDLALNAFFFGDYDAMVQSSGHAMSPGPPTVTAIAVHSFALAMTGAVPEAQRHCDAAAALVDAQSDEDIAAAPQALAWLTAAEFYVERPVDSVRHGRRGLEIARANGIGELVPAMAQGLANALFTSGHILEAGALLDEVTEAARVTDSSVGVAWARLNRAFAALCEGDLETADEASLEAWTVALEGSPVAAWAGAMRGKALLEQGDPQRALELLQSSGGESGEQIAGAWRATWLEWAAECCLGIDDPAGARRYAALARARADAFGLDGAPAAAFRAEARNFLVGGDPSAAAVAAEQAVRHAVAYGNRTEAAAAHVIAGSAHAAMGSTDEAVAAFERAVAIYEACGAYRRRAIPERELRRLGRSTHRRTRPGSGDGVGALTGRELEVASLIVDRRTNPEIAAALFLSVKTVETHVRHIFRKLDVASRADIARVMEAQQK